MRSYYYEQLDPAEKQYYLQLLDAVQKEAPGCTSFIITSPDRLKNITSAVEYDHPELFHTELNRFCFEVYPWKIKQKLYYKFAGREKQGREQALKQKISELTTYLKRANPRDEADQCMWFYRYLVEHTSYNEDALSDYPEHKSAFDASGVLLDNKGVCIGISKAFQLLCGTVGVDCRLVTGRTILNEEEGGQSDGEHAWNILSIHGKSGHVDATWDISMSRSSGQTRVDYFFVPDVFLQSDHEYHGPQCDGEQYSYFAHTGKLFATGAQLQQYLDAELSKQGIPTLYFKINRAPSVFNNISSTIDTQVYQAARSHGYRVCIKVHNSHQMCFFYRLETVGGG